MSANPDGMSAAPTPPLPLQTNGQEGSASAKMAADVLDMIARFGGWWEWARVWRRLCKRFDLEWFLSDADTRRGITLVPDDVSSIMGGIARNTPLVLVRPGIYVESVRITTNVTLLGVGPVGAATVIAPGWEPALVWGGFKAGKTSASARGSGHGAGAHIDLDAASGGSRAEVRGMSFTQRNQLQQTAVYITVGEPHIAQCDIVGTVHVAGSGAQPTLSNCHISRSRSCGVRFVDHSSGSLHGCVIAQNCMAAVRLATNAGSPCIVSGAPRSGGNIFRGNGYDGVLRAGQDDEDSDEEFFVSVLDSEDGDVTGDTA